MKTLNPGKQSAPPLQLAGTVQTTQRAACEEAWSNGATKTVKTQKPKATLLSHNHYAISDRLAARLAREHATAKRLPRPGYCVDVPWGGGMATLARTTLCLCDPIKNKRGWVWTVMPHATLN